MIRVARTIMHDKTNIVDVFYEVLAIEKISNETRVINEVHNMRYFFRAQLETFLKETEFELIDNLECKTLEETVYSSWTSYFVARAI